VYNSNILNKKKPKVIQHILTSNFTFDLSCGNTFKLKKNIIRAAFQHNFCRGFSPFSYEASKALIKKVKVQTVLFALHCSKDSIKPLEKSFLQDDISKTPAANVFSRFLKNPFKTKINTVPCFFGKRADADLLTLDLKLNNLFIFYKQIQNKRHFLNLKKTLASSRRPLIFIKTISEVLNKAIKKSRLPTKISKKQEQSPFFFGPLVQKKKPTKGFLSSTVPLGGSLVFSMKNKKSFFYKKKKDKEHVKNQEIDARWFTVSEGSSSLANQKRRSSQMWAAYPFKNKREKGGEFFGGSLVRADWVLGKFVEQLSKRKMNPRAVINQQINDIRLLIDKMGSESPIKGMRITITGRLGSRKKAMAQQVSKYVGKVPLSTFRQKVDYKQSVLPTRLGLIGIKIWVCYANGIS
jgi:hypothetical protein